MRTPLTVMMICLVLSLIAQQSPKNILTGKWHFSYEESTGDTLVYRPEGFDFPPSRGREGMVFYEDGKFARSSIGPTCGFLMQYGTWKIHGKNIFIRKQEVSDTSENQIMNDQVDDFVMNIISAENDKLVVIRKTDQPEKDKYGIAAPEEKNLMEEKPAPTLIKHNFSDE